MEQKIVLRKHGDKLTSAISSLVVDMNDSDPEFRKAGYVPEILREMTAIDEQYILETYPEYAEGIKSGELKVVPTKMKKWTAGKNGYYHEIDFVIEKTPKPRPVVQETYTIEQPRIRPRMQNPTVQNTGWRGDFQNFFDTSGIGVLGLGMREPLYVFYETRPGVIRQAVVSIIVSLLEITTVAALLDEGGKERRRYKEGLRELSKITGKSIPQIEERIAAMAREFQQYVEKTRYWREDVYAVSQ